MIRTKLPKEKPLYTKKELEKILTYKQQAFCQEYIRNGWNGTKAAIYAGFNPNSAASLSSELLRKLNIKTYISLIKGDLETLCGISKPRQLKEYSKIAYSSISHMHNKWTELKDFESLTNDQKEAIESIEFKEVPTKHGIITYVKLKLYSKTVALEAIDRLMGYKAAEKVDITSKGNQINAPLDLSALSTEELRTFGQLQLKIKGVSND